MRTFTYDTFIISLHSSTLMFCVCGEDYDLIKVGRKQYGKLKEVVFDTTILERELDKAELEWEEEVTDYGYDYYVYH